VEGDDSTLQERGPAGVSSPSESDGNADTPAPTLEPKGHIIHLRDGRYGFATGQLGENH